MRDPKIDKESDRLLAEADLLLSEDIDELLKIHLEKITDQNEKNKIIAIINEHKSRWAEEEIEREKENQKEAVELEKYLHEQKIYSEQELRKLKIVIWLVGIMLLAAYLYIEYSTNV